MRKDVFNFKLTEQMEKVGAFDMPQVKKFEEKELNCKFLIVTPFNYAMTETEPQSKICHFYIDDYQFERIWAEPQSYVEILKKFNAVIGPDFSMYSNLPKAQQIYNNWRNKVLMAFFQAQGIKVIPNVQWANKDSFSYCFDGIGPGGVVAICSTGCHKKESKQKFIEGYNKMLDVVHPRKIICVGKLPTELEKDEKIFQIKSFMEEKRKLWAAEEQNLDQIDKKAF